MDRKPAGRREILLVFSSFLLIFFCARLPLFSLGWDGLDGSGHDADIFFHQPTKPNYLLFGRIRGQEIYAPPTGHPAPIYQMYALLGKAVQWIIPFQNFSDTQIIILLKVIASLFQLTVWIPLLWLTMRHRTATIGRLVGYLGITGLALSPLAIQGSNEFQLDSTFGFTMAGAYALALLFVASKKPLDPLGFLTIAAAAAFLGLGKNEWTIVLAGACGALLIVKLTTGLPRIQEEDQNRQFFTCMSATVVGLGVGNVASYLSEPALYMSGYQLIAHMLEGSSIASGSGRNHFAEINLQRLRYTQTPIFLIAFIIWYGILGRFRFSPALMLALIFSLGLFSAFFVSTFEPFGRYFAPALAALSVTAVWMWIEVDFEAAPLLTLACMIASCWLAVGGVRFARSNYLATISIHGTRDIQPRADCALLLPVEDGYRRKDLDFAHIGWGFQGAEEFARSFGEHICAPR